MNTEKDFLQKTKTPEKEVRKILQDYNKYLDRFEVPFKPCVFTQRPCRTNTKKQKIAQILRAWKHRLALIDGWTYKEIVELKERM